MKTSLKNTGWMALLGSFMLFSACTENPEPTDTDDATATDSARIEQPTPAEATAQLAPTEGFNASGTVTFTQMGGGVRVVAEVMGVPEGQHGFHIHETGDCSAPDAGSAGGHFNPTDTPHGAPDNAVDQRHVGDLGNLEASADSTGTYDRTDTVISLQGPNAIVGKAVILHAGADDLTSQPSGDAGDRMACGVIEISDTM
ncbi:MAG TPA: superoxide dismutase family protein [Rhodothermales bacterium]|nr:superoxide dismutase family protein [Rhodothermales bacterium]